MPYYLSQEADSIPLDAYERMYIFSSHGLCGYPYNEFNTPLQSCYKVGATFLLMVQANFFTSKLPFFCMNGVLYSVIVQHSQEETGVAGCWLPTPKCKLLSDTGTENIKSFHTASRHGKVNLQCLYVGSWFGRSRQRLWGSRAISHFCTICDSWKQHCSQDGASFEGQFRPPFCLVYLHPFHLWMLPLNGTNYTCLVLCWTRLQRSVVVRKCCAHWQCSKSIL